MAGPTGIEPATYGLRVRRSSLAELRARNVSFEKKVSLRNIELTVFNVISLNKYVWFVAGYPVNTFFRVF
jgi:hypothetical protein